MVVVADMIVLSTDLGRASIVDGLNGLGSWTWVVGRVRGETFPKGKWIGVLENGRDGS